MTSHTPATSSPHRAPIGVFDSGIGGLSVLQALRTALPQRDVIYLADSGFAPYGERTEAFVVARSQAIASWLVGQGVAALVVACNTATAAAIAVLRAQYPSLPIVGVEPALKPAVALSRTGHIGVMATRNTLSSAKYQALLATQVGAADFTCQPCDGLAAAIELSAVSGDTVATARLCAQHVAAMGGAVRFGGRVGQMDTLVLGCTHYPFVSDALQALVGPDVQLIHTGPAVARQTQRLLELLPASAAVTAAAAETAEKADMSTATIRLVSTGQPGRLQAAARRWLGDGDALEELIFL